VDRNQRANLVDHISQHAEFFHDPENHCYAVLRRNGHEETWPIESKDFELWVSQLSYSLLNETPGSSDLESIKNQFTGIARFDGYEKSVYLRVGHDADSIYLDLCNDSWDIVQVRAGHVEIARNCPVRFRRTSAMRHLPLPIEGGDLSELFAHVNIANKDDRLLLVAALLESFRPNTPFPILVFEGQQGCGKSKTQDRLRDLVDPSKANLRAAPRRVEDIFVGATNNWFYSLNNLSHLSASQQDALCTLSTGGGYAARTLYTDLNETVAEVMRPVMMNGIRTLPTAQDLIDRCIVFELPIISESQRKSERKLDQEFQKARPRILGAILSALAKTMRYLPEVELPRAPRMADFAELGVAAERALGWGDGNFLDAYERNRIRSMAHGIESSPVALAVCKMIADTPEGYSGPIGYLSLRLDKYRPPDTTAWPKSARGLADTLRRQAPALLQAEEIKIEFDEKRHQDGYHIKIYSVALSRRKNERHEHDEHRTAEKYRREVI
jgi:hypothetical protein